MAKSDQPDPLNDEHTARFRNILKGEDEEKPASSSDLSSSTTERIRTMGETASSPRRLRGSRLPAANPVLELKPGAKTESSAADGIRSRNERYRAAFWTVTGTISLVVDAVLIAVVITLLFYVRGLNNRIKDLMSLSSLPLDTVSGLYKNFELMNEANIITTIPYNTEIPVEFDIQINQQTEVVLSQDTPINGARVTLTTGGLEISSAPANIILPAGTRLPITLSLNVPVSRNVPVNLLVPVDIDLATSELGVPFAGLMDVLEPLYCMLDPLAVDSRGVSICEKSETP